MAVKNSDFSRRNKMDNKTRIKILELSFNIMESMLLSKDFASKAELMSAMKTAVDRTSADEKMPIELKLGYAEAYKKLNGLTWEEIKEIKDIITSD